MPCGFRNPARCPDAFAQFCQYAVTCDLDDVQYHSLEPTGQKMSRILLYIVHKYNSRELSREAYQVAHILMTEAWRRVNDDPEFCEQTELELELGEL